MLYLVIFFVVALLLLVLFVTKLNVIVDYKLSGKDDWGTVTFSAFGGLLKYNIKLPVRKRKDAGDSIEKKGREGAPRDKLNNIKEVYKSIAEIRKYLGKKIILDMLRLKVHIGTGDACETGILSGFAWTILGTAVSYVINSFRLSKAFNTDIAVNPYFVEKKFIIELYCIFDIKFVHIIVVALKYKISKKKKQKKAKNKNKNKMTNKGGMNNVSASNRRSDENGYGKHKGNG
ncbi:DUF2953 domain-containing protein [Pseudoclostridium thermosuccinogenes]|uniref:DUF2953 domain-containing protein n=1 Tax=Clostridium thermosuccinogenes TaxID=84032 RepID=UPI002FD93510